MLVRAATLLGAGTLLGCSASERALGPVAPLTAVAETDGLRLTNPGAEPVYFEVIAANYVLTSAFGFQPCVEPPICSSVEPGESVQLPYETILGYSPTETKELFVYRWLLRATDDNDYSAAGVDVLIVRVPPR